MLFAKEVWQMPPLLTRVEWRFLPGSFGLASERSAKVAVGPGLKVTEDDADKIYTCFDESFLIFLLGFRGSCGPPNKAQPFPR